MQQLLHETFQDVLQVLQAVTAELHAHHGDATPASGGRGCDEESCRSLSQLEAQLDTLRRAFGLASFRSRSF